MKNKKNKKLKLFKVYYFTGDAMSSKGEQLHHRYERAESEKEIEYLYLDSYYRNKDEHYAFSEVVK